MANENNLKVLDHNEAVEQGRKGGIASGIARNKNKSFSELIKQIARQEITDLHIKKELEERGLDNDIRNYLVLQLYNEAVKNKNIKAITKLIDLFIAHDNNDTFFF